MGKRKSDSSSGKNKKFKAAGFIDPSTTGIYATCNRGKEQQCRKELMNLFSEKIPEYFNLEEEVEDDDEDLSIEDQIQKEINGIKQPPTKELLKPIELGCECLVFIKTRKPIKPEILVERICRESLVSQVKNTRYTQKLSPVTYSVTPTVEELKKLAAIVLAPHFHQKDQKPLTFAIQISKRNFNTLERADMIQTIAECVGNDHGHSVDLKKYQKLILVECYKSNVGMSVVNDYLAMEKFNLQLIFDRHGSGGELRVNKEVSAKEPSDDTDLKEDSLDIKDDSTVVVAEETKTEDISVGAEKNAPAGEELEEELEEFDELEEPESDEESEEEYEESEDAYSEDSE